jgi:hypothetical protein
MEKVKNVISVSGIRIERRVDESGRIPLPYEKQLEEFKRNLFE